MLKRVLIYSILVLAQTGCSGEEGGGAYNPGSLTDQVRKEMKGLNREFLNIEDIRLGDGAPAAHHNRRG